LHRLIYTALSLVSEFEIEPHHSCHKLILSYFNADKINIASFGNLLPQVHWHIMARFETDSYFPEISLLFNSFSMPPPLFTKESSASLALYA
jgi:hypothetical protein